MTFPLAAQLEALLAAGAVPAASTVASSSTAYPGGGLHDHNDPNIAPLIIEIDPKTGKRIDDPLPLVDLPDEDDGSGSEDDNDARGRTNSTGKAPRSRPSSPGSSVRQLANAFGLDCEMCKMPDAAYKCPGCGRSTCSVKCSKEHKFKFHCTGRRIHFEEKKLNEMDDKTLLQDLVFLDQVNDELDRDHRARQHALEDATNPTAAPAKFGTGNGDVLPTGPEGHAGGLTVAEVLAAAEKPFQSRNAKKRAKKQQFLGREHLVTEAKSRRTKLFLSPNASLDVAKSNTSFFDKEAGKIHWKLEWRFFGGEGRVETFLEEPVSEDMQLCDVLVGRYVAPADGVDGAAGSSSFGAGAPESSLGGVVVSGEVEEPSTKRRKLSSGGNSSAEKIPPDEPDTPSTIAASPGGMQQQHGGGPAANPAFPQGPPRSQPSSPKIGAQERQHLSEDADFDAPIYEQTELKPFFAAFKEASVRVFIHDKFPIANPNLYNRQQQRVSTALVEVDLSRSLRDTLSGREIAEYPRLLVVPSDLKDTWPIFENTKEVDTRDGLKIGDIMLATKEIVYPPAVRRGVRGAAAAESDSEEDSSSEVGIIFVW